MLIFIIAAAAVVIAGEPTAQPAPVDNALELLVIELFFLLVGLLVAAILAYLIWQSWRNKKNKERKI
jgi:NhaP-type Na+/H+ or K+/H+ antiporter